MTMGNTASVQQQHDNATDDTTPFLVESATTVSSTTSSTTASNNNNNAASTKNNGSTTTTYGSLNTSTSIESELLSSTTESDNAVAPIIQVSKHLLKPNGSILGKDVATVILPKFPSLVSCIPRTTANANAKVIPAICSIDGRYSITHEQIYQFIISLESILHNNIKIGCGHRIALILPNGSELAVAIVSLSNYCCIVPLNSNAGEQELIQDIIKCGADIIIGYDPIETSIGHTIEQIAIQLQLPFCGLIPDNDYAGLFRLVPNLSTYNKNIVANNSTISYQSGSSMLSSFIPCKSLPLSLQGTSGADINKYHKCYNKHSDIVLVLFTSGTTGSKKLVPHTLGNILISATTICISWNLSSIDINCNLMPLFHVGGILRQVYSPLFSGGCVICCPSFDPLTFWNLLMNNNNNKNSKNSNKKTTATKTKTKPMNTIGGNNNSSSSTITTTTTTTPSNVLPTFTWYYAAPTMHQLILQTGRAEGYIPEYDSSISGSGSTSTSTNTNTNTNNGPTLRMIANAAGGLLPSLARELRTAFNGVYVLPSYGMTECMPISAPPYNYTLDRPGTSGVAVGPELAILNKDTLQTVPYGIEGPICVKSEPLFNGYGTIYNSNGTPESNSTDIITFIPQPGSSTSTKYVSSGWFDTGDIGYMDSDGYLYITGRSKEVINRGGEIISPMEVEDVIVNHEDIDACAAFTVPHDILQEVVGIVIVMKQNRPRIDLLTLHNYLANHLTTVKWPQCIVYMTGGLPKSFTNKLLRVNLHKRFNLIELNDSMTPIERTFEAICPPQGTEISVPIPCTSVHVNPAVTETILYQHCIASKTNSENNDQHLIVRNHPTKKDALVAYVYNIDRKNVISIARETLDGYSIPSHIVTVDQLAILKDDTLLPVPQPSDAIASIVDDNVVDDTVQSDPIIIEIQELMQLMLKLDCIPSAHASFFNLGGGSMLASQLAAKIRKMYKVQFGGAEVFQNSTCSAIACIVHERRAETIITSSTSSVSGSTASTTNDDADDSSLSDKEGNGGNSNDCDTPTKPLLLNKKKSSTNTNKTLFDSTRIDTHSASFVYKMIQLIPLFILYPIWQLTRIYLFFQTLLYMLNEVPGPKNLAKFIITLISFHFIWVTISPLLFILLKWCIIGKYIKGRYPIWSNYYLRWWFVDVLRKMIGRGIWGSHDYTLNMYYRMLGAKIGKNVHISPQADIAEYDLISIGENACIEYATCRSFGIDNGCMVLGPVTVGTNSSVGIRSVVAPYTTIPDNKHLAPASSSYNLNAYSSTDDDDDKHLRYNRQALPQPSALSQTLIVGPIMLLVNSFSHIPALAILWWMLHQPWNYEYPFQNIGHMMQWFCEPRRIPFFIGIRIVRALVCPFFYMFASIIVKRCVIGKFEPGPRNTNSEWQLIRHNLAAQLFTREKVQQVTELLGRHYELVSMLYRLLGAKIGKRIFWPGRQPVFTGEYDLLEIGDDVVFGSRSTLICTTKTSAERIILCAGSNVSDNTVVLPGSTIGKGAVLGSNAVCPAGRYLPEGSLWFGVRNGEPVMLDKGVENTNGPAFTVDIDTTQLEMKGDLTTLRPFGKAFYYDHANYFVYPLQLIIAFTIVTRVIVAALSSISIIGAVHLTAGHLYGWPIYERDYFYIHVPFTSLYTMMLFYFCTTHFVHTAIWFIAEMVLKWGIIGQRQEGRYNYDQSGYCQNWEVYQIATKVRELGRMNFLDFIRGTPHMVTYFRLLGCKIGEDCCLYPSGGDPYMPEPDLVEMGDRCVIDCASVVCHLNTSGNFELVKITMENNVTLRTRARIQQGVYMESGSMLLEKCLAMTGEVIDADSVWLGAPATKFLSYDCNAVNTSIAKSTSYNYSASSKLI